MIQPPSGPATLKDLADCTEPAIFTMGRISCAVTYQGCNSWTILRIAVDYYEEMARRYPDSTIWKETAAALLGTEKKWADANNSCNTHDGGI